MPPGEMSRAWLSPIESLAIPRGRPTAFRSRTPFPENEQPIERPGRHRCHSPPMPHTQQNLTQTIFINFSIAYGPMAAAIIKTHTPRNHHGSGKQSVCKGKLVIQGRHAIHFHDYFKHFKERTATESIHPILPGRLKPSINSDTSSTPCLEVSKARKVLQPRENNS